MRRTVLTRPRRLAIASAVVAAVGAIAGLFSPPADAAVQWVRTEGQFHAAVWKLRHSGGLIVLQRGVYRRLVVGERSRRWLRIAGRPGVRVERLVLNGAQKVSVGRLTIAPRTRNAWIRIKRSRNIDLHHLRVTARRTRHSAGIVVRDGIGVTIRRSDFAHCGDRARAMTNCVQLRRWARHVTIRNNRFHDCFGCDFIHGRFGYNLRLLRNRFERALPCDSTRLGAFRCGHQDLVELFEGRRLRVEGNRFGVYQDGGAQLYLTGPIDHVTIVNNVFVGVDPAVPGYRARMGLIVGSRYSRRLPHYVRVANNTILTGELRRDGYSGSLRLSSRYGLVPRRKRPVIANNVIRLFETPVHVCSASRAFVSNVIIHGYPCSPSDRVGGAALDSRGWPTARSRLLINRAHRGHAPARDARGRPRLGRPDIGAFEYRAH